MRVTEEPEMLQKLLKPYNDRPHRLQKDNGTIFKGVMYFSVLNLARVNVEFINTVKYY